MLYPQARYVVIQQLVSEPVSTQSIKHFDYMYTCECVHVSKWEPAETTKQGQGPPYLNKSMQLKHLYCKYSLLTVESNRS